MGARCVTKQQRSRARLRVIVRAELALLDLAKAVDFYQIFAGLSSSGICTK
jgi:hypothetical protein